jgi:SAM-dependent methyltransferase
MKSWFESWFNTSYYHILYKNRNDQEAQDFMDALCAKFSFQPTQKILDLACGKGRHAIYLNSLGLTVDGADLSPESIDHANRSANDTLHFYVHDMRNPLPKSYDVVLNMFTSFGYFENEKENIQVLQSVKKALSKNGLLIIDFLNLAFVKQHLIANETKIIDGIDFHISKKVTLTHILKDIRFTDKGNDYHYTEKVQALGFNHFEQLANQAGLVIKMAFGDYKLKPLIPQQSERLILVLGHQ